MKRQHRLPGTLIFLPYVDFSHDIELLSHESPEVAEKALNRIRPRVGRVLTRLLKNMSTSDQDSEEIVQDALTKLWQKRLHVKFRSEGRFWGYLSLIARRERYRRRQPSFEPEPTDISDRDAEDVEAVAQNSVTRQRLQAIADELWLRAPIDESDDQRNQRILAAQLLIVEETEWEEICDLLRHSAYVSRDQVDQWARDPSTLLSLAYRQVFFGNDALAGYLLSPQTPLDETEVQEFIRNEKN